LKVLLYQVWFVEGEEYWEIDLSALDGVHSTVIKKVSRKDKSVIKEQHQIVILQETGHVGKPLGVRKSTTA
jgi:hypothetical protein